MRLRRTRTPQSPLVATAGHVTIRIQDSAGEGVSSVLSDRELAAEDARWLLEAKACMLAGAFWTQRQGHAAAQ